MDKPLGSFQLIDSSHAGDLCVGGLCFLLMIAVVLPEVIAYIAVRMP